MRDIHLSVLTPADLSQLSLAKLALSAILETHEDLRPKRIGNWEPLKQKADDHTTIDDFLANWAHPFLWNHAKRSEGAIFLGGGNRHSAIYLSCMSTRVQPSAIAQLARRVSSELNADFASVYVHYEMGDAGRRRYDALYPLIRGVTTHDLRNSLPDLPWFTVFGPPYLDLLGSARLLSCPAYAVGEQPTGFPFGSS